MKEAVTKVIDTLTQEDFHGAFQKLLERYQCIAVGGDYFEGDWSLMCVLSIKVPMRKKSLETYLMILVDISGNFSGEFKKKLGSRYFFLDILISKR